MSRITPVILFAALAALHLTACASCPFEERCNGNVLEVCSLGVDQMFGDPSYSSSPCEDPNPVCVATGSGSAQCAVAADATCADGTPDRCEAQARAVRCLSGYEVAEACAPDGNDCLMVDSAAHCAIGPARTCDRETYDNSCEDSVHLLYCINGLVTRKDCSLDKPGVCAPNTPKDQYEQTAYCESDETAVSDAGVDGG